MTRNLHHFDLCVLSRGESVSPLRVWIGAGCARLRALRLGSARSVVPYEINENSVVECKRCLRCRSSAFDWKVH